MAAKLFGEKTELLIDRDAERQVVVDLSRQGFGPKVSPKTVQLVWVTSQGTCIQHRIRRVKRTKQKRLCTVG